MALSAHATPYRGEGDISFLEFWRALVGDWWLIGIIVALAAALSAVIAFTLTPMYRAEVVIVEVGDTRSGAGSAAMLAQFGGLAGLAGIDLGTAGEGTGRARAILNSRMLIEEFISRNELLPVIFAEHWDTDSGKPPTLWLGVRRFIEDVRTVSEDLTAGVIRISVEWKDPEIAAKWANGLVKLANEIVRTRDLSDAERNVAYLNDEIARTNVVELRQVLYSLIETEMKTIMLANVKDEYAFAVIDPAVPPEMRSFPRRSFLVVIGTVLGAFIALLAVLVRLVMKKQRERENIAA